MDKLQNTENQTSLRNFDSDKAFFVIDSDNINQVESKLYGFCIVNGTITDDIESLSGSEPTEDGAYVYIKRDGDIITIKQDFVGCYGLYLYTDKDYFAISNSFIYLVNYIKTRRKITFNQCYADYFLTVGLCSSSYSETMINEISLLDRSAVITLNVADRSMSLSYIDYKENTVDLDSEEGIKILDDWYIKWTSIIRNLFEKNVDIMTDLSGGFDSRITFLLVLTSGIDLNKFWVNSANDDLHTHAEDYKIASDISKYFDFPLNNRQKISEEMYNYSINDIFDISLYLKECFHKQMYFHRFYTKKRRYKLNGFGGECIRAFPSYHKDEETIIRNAVNGSKKFLFNAKQAERVENSIRRILQNTFTKIHKKYDSLGRPLSDLTNFAFALYRETRNRSHFGKQLVEHYYSNLLYISPLLDKNLSMLSFSIKNDSDGDLIYAVIFDRYCSKLLDFEFEGNRSFSDSTLQYAKKINTKFPYVKSLCPSNVDVKIKEKDVQMCDIKRVANEVPDKLIKSAFCSEEIKSLFLRYYNEEAYNYILQDANKRTYHPLQDVYTVLGICEIMKAVSANESILSCPSDFIISHYDESSNFIHNKFDHIPLYNHPLIEDYITARIDIKNSGSDDNDIIINDISDKSASVQAPEWFKKNGHGYVIHSQNGAINITFQCLTPGTLSISLRSKDIRNKKGERILIGIDFHKLCINDEEIFNDIHTVSHDKPFSFTKKVVDGEIITLYTEWIPYDIRKGLSLS